MTKRERQKLQLLLVRLTAWFSDPAKQSTYLSRSEARAIVAAIRELDKLEKAT